MYMATAPGKHVSVRLKTSSCHFVFTHYVVTSAMLNLLWLCNVTKYVLVCLLWWLAQLVVHQKIQYIFSNVNLPIPMNLLILQCIYLAYFLHLYNLCPAYARDGACLSLVYDRLE